MGDAFKIASFSHFSKKFTLLFVYIDMMVGS